MDFTTLFVTVDDFWKTFEAAYRQHLIEEGGYSSSDGKQHRERKGQLSISECMTILIAFQTGGHRNFKHYYAHLLQYHRRDFPDLVAYSRFVALIPRLLIPLSYFFTANCLGTVTGINFIDSTALKVCGNKRISRNQVFDGLAATGKTSMGWFHGFKLHLVINERGELLAFTVTAGNVDDRKPVPHLVKRLWGKLFGDKGYISQKLFDDLFAGGLKLITGIRDNMHNKLVESWEKMMLRKRSLIETVNDQLKNVCQIEHTRHRSPVNFFTHLICALIAYAMQPKKPSIRMEYYDNCPLLLT